VTKHERTKQVTEQKVNDARNQLKNITKELDRLNNRETDLKKQSNNLRDKQDTLTREHDSMDDKKRDIDRNLSLARTKQNDNEREVTSLSGKMASKENLARILKRAVDGNTSEKSERHKVTMNTNNNSDDDEDFDKRRGKKHLVRSFSHDKSFLKNLFYLF
jgi:chromosome segregation ATPase